MRNKGRMIAWILITVLLCGQIPTQAYAQTQFTQTVSAGEDTEGTVDTINAGMVSGENAMQAGLGNEISMRGENSFGTMLSSQLSAEMAEQQENNGCNVFSVEMEGDAAIVSFESVQDAFLVIGIYDETGTELLTSGSLEIFAGETTAVVEFEEGSIPQYFYIKGYLVEAGTYRPLCSVYESPMYTQEMQEFLAKTTADFDADRVLNLDEYETNNFAVFAEETILISGDNGQNDVTMADESSNTYVIEDADSSITSLQPGDIFAYPYQENEVLIVKVANIVVDGTTVTITGADTAMEEVFDYIKIDAEMGSGEATVDASSCDDGVTYEGLVDYVDEGTPQTYGFEAGGSIEKAFKLKLDKEFSNIEGISVGISGGLEMKLKLSAKVYLTFTTQYVELKLDYSAKISADITGKANAEIPLVTVGFMFTGIIVELKPSIVIESKATISLDGTLSGTVGFRAEAGSGIINLTKAPKFTSQIKVEGSIFFGISLCPRVKILSDKVASASLTAKVGAEVKASYTYPIKQDEEKKHICTVCIAGEINGKFTISAELKFLNQAKLTITPVDLSMKISDFYYSADYDEFGWSSCPYYLLKGKIVVLDTSQQPIPNVRVTTNGEELTTNEQGTAEFWASAKQYTFSIEKEGFATVYRDLTLKKGGERLLVILLKANGDSGDTGDSEGGNSGESSGGNEDGSEIMPEEAILQVSLGESHSAVIMEGGDLYLCGANYEGELGDGTTTNSTIPKKIMSGVKEVSLGYYHSATITEGGDLYLWGHNYDGQLGDGTTTTSTISKKINIPSITAITNDTPLFTASAINEILVASEQQSQWNGTNFTNLIPNETYNYYVMMNRYADTPFSTDNLLYIGQAVSDESGNLNVVFSSEVASAGEDIFAVPMHQIDLSDAKVTVEDLTYNGTQQYAKVVVSYQDTILVEGVDYNVVGDYGVTQTGDYTLTIEGIGLYTGTISASYRVLKENVAVTGITLNKSTLTLKDGETATLTATILPDDADNKNVTWSSNNVAVATVTNGTVTALKSGTVKITATTEDGKKTADCLITVTCAHAMTKTDAVSATCTKDGNITYYTCSKCGKKFTDKAGTKEAGNTVIKATGHTVVNKWESDSTAHWKACKNCNSKFDKANHSFQWVVDKTATEDVAGIKHEECACGRKRSEGTVIPKLDKVPAKEGWEEVNGQKFWYENGIKQGTEGRGKEIYDPETDAWYWLDAVQDGAVAVNKDVYQESYSAYPDRPDGTGKWVRYDENGRMVKGWQSTDAGIYYFEVITGSMAKGDVEIDGKRYYFNEDTGILEHRPEFADGWHEVDGTLYWYEGGKRQGWNPADESYRGKEIYDPVSDGWYWLDNVQNGAKAVSKDVYQESYSAYPDREDGTGKWGRYDANGRMIKGWQTTDAGTYYFEEVTGSMAKGHVTIDGAEYYFDEATGILR